MFSGMLIQENRRFVIVSESLRCVEGRLTRLFSWQLPAGNIWSRVNSICCADGEVRAASNF
jgi:hypothetical protein